MSQRVSDLAATYFALAVRAHLAMDGVQRQAFTRDKFAVVAVPPGEVRLRPATDDDDADA